MDALTKEIKGRFREKTRFVNSDGEPSGVEPSDHDIYLFHSLEFHYHYLNNEYIAALQGRPYNPVTQRTAQLKYLHYLELSPEQEHNRKAHYRGPLFYKRGPRGTAELEDRGYIPFKRPTPVNLRHQVMIDQMVASIEIGVKANPYLSMTFWEDILKLPKTPDTTRQSKSAYVQLTPDNDGERYLRADGLPFLITRTFNDKPEQMFFLGVEADCHTRSVPDMKKKFENYVEMYRDGLHTEHFGAKRAYVILGTPAEARLLRLMAAWEQVTEHCPQHRKYMLFVRHPMYTSHDKPRATGHMVTEPLRRVGLPDLIIGKP